jgi:hypothetical protein
LVVIGAVWWEFVGLCLRKQWEEFVVFCWHCL